MATEHVQLVTLWPDKGKFQSSSQAKICDGGTGCQRRKSLSSFGPVVEWGVGVYSPGF